MVLSALPLCGSADEKPFTLWYDKPATRFEEALPLGNGSIGVMVYGNPDNEILNLNEATLWGGGPTNTNPTPDAPSFLPKVRELLFQQEWGKASRLLRNIQGPNGQTFVPMGNLYIHQDIQEPVNNYSRELNLNTATATVRFSTDSVEYTREFFVSAPAKALVIRFKASRPGMLNLSVDGDTPFWGCSINSLSPNEFSVSGQLPYSVNTDRKFPIIEKGATGEKGMRYQYRVKALLVDGQVSTTPGLRIEKASEVVLLLTAATSYNGFDKRPDTEGKDEKALAGTAMNEASAKSYDTLLAEHLADYQTLFNSVSLHLGHTEKTDTLTTDRRLSAYAKGSSDSGLEELYFQFGRYLLISSSRPGGVPMNLQGIWNNRLRPSWGSNYTTNINLEMNYWPAEPLGLSSLTEPLLHYIHNASVTGSQVVKNFYNMHGWTVHHNSDIWAHANPVGHQKGDPKWANWALGAPWLCQHLYEHYRFTQDKQFLANEAYPLMKSAAEFCKDWMIEKDGYYITAPSTSPENVFIDDNGRKGNVTIASTMDSEIIWDLFNNLIEASIVLDKDEREREEWTDIRNRLYPLRIGKEGNLIEWYKDWKDADPQHRHVSHLFGLHPGRQINPLKNPELAAACRKTLEVRGDGGTGWSKAWKINFWARLLDGNHAYKMYRELLSHSTLPNLFDTHPPFQIDGNFGSIAGIGEMLLQSQFDELHLLPALPDAWSCGEVKGLCARGAFTVDMQWSNGRLKTAQVTSKAGNKCVIRTNCNIKVKGVRSKCRKDGNYFVTTFSTKAGKTYNIEASTR